jgi:hypothetical protein
MVVLVGGWELLRLQPEERQQREEHGSRALLVCEAQPDGGNGGRRRGKKAEPYFARLSFGWGGEDGFERRLLTGYRTTHTAQGSSTRSALQLPNWQTKCASVLGGLGSNLA